MILHYYIISYIDLGFNPLKKSIAICYGPYIQDSTGTKKELVLDQNQCTGHRTDGTSKAIK